MYIFYHKILCRAKTCTSRNLFRLSTAISRLNEADKRKIIMRINLTAVFLIASLLQVSAGGFAQKLTMHQDRASVKQIFKEIRKQTGYDVFYLPEVINDKKVVIARFSNTPIQQVMEKCLEGQQLTFAIFENSIVIRKQPSSFLEKLKDYLNAADIRGKVVDENGMPLPGASVKVKGTTRAASTNARGEFILENVDKDAILVVSFLGYLTKEVKATAELNVITLTVSNSKLDEVKVIAYGTTTQRKNTGNVGKVSAEEISKQPVSNPLGTLQGRVPGLFVTQKTGVPGGGFTVQIRGRNSISNGSNPLYIVDGVPFISTSLSTTLDIGAAVAIDPFNSLNPSDIESIEVLKDADATAIYGSSGANGVILITTKKGKAGKTKIDVNVYGGAGEMGRRMEFLNTQQYLEMRREAFKNDGATPGEADYDLTTWDQNKYTDWQDKLVGGTAHVTNAQLSVSGGNTNTQFLMGGGYARETTVFPGKFADQKGSAHFNLNHLTDDQKFRATLSVNYVAGTNNLPRIDVTRYSNLAPNAPDMVKPNGDMNWEAGITANPFSQFYQKYQATPESLTSNLLLNYTILPGLQIRTSLGYNRLLLDEVTTFPLFSLHPAFGYESGFSVFANGKNKSWIIEPQAEYQVQMGKGKLNALLGTTLRKDVTQGQTLFGEGYSADDLLENIAAASLISSFSSNYAVYRYNAIFGRLKYDYLDKYLINLTARRDGSSRFGPGKQFSNFGSVGLGWIFSGEQFMQDKLPFLSFGKLRGSYGITGNDQIGDYRFMNLYSPTFRSYQGTVGLAPSSLFNADFSWETNKKLEAAIELGFFKNRFLFNISWYRNRSSSQLLNYPLPATTGFPSIQANLPAKVQNTGWEFELNSNTITGEGFNWTTSFNLTVPRNKLLEFPGLATSSYANIYEIGKPLGLVKALHYTGVDPQTGVYQFEDKSKDGSVTRPTDLQSLKTIAQDFYGGLNNTFKYKGLQLDVFFQFVKQTGRNYMSTMSPPGSLGNQPVYVLDRWQKPGDNKPVQQFTQNAGSAAYLAYENGVDYGDFTVGDASFIRLKNVSLSWQVPAKWTAKGGFSACRVYLQGQNLVTITDYKGWDPETQTNSLPPLRMLTAGIQLTF